MRKTTREMRAIQEGKQNNEETDVVGNVGNLRRTQRRTLL